MNPKERVDKLMDYTYSLPDECLALIFDYLTTTKDRNCSSLVSHRWHRIDAQTRTHLTLNALPDPQNLVQSIFTRFNSLTQLVLRKESSINDNAMILITSMCPNLTHLKLICSQITDSGMALFSKNCKKLKEFSCGNLLGLTDYGLAELLDNCGQLEVLYVHNLRSRGSVGDPTKLRAGAASKTLKVIELTCADSERLFVPLISSCKKLKSLKVRGSRGNWDRVLEVIPDDNCLAEVYLQRLKVTDVGVTSLAKCRELITLHMESLRCSHVGLTRVAENCKGLKKLCVCNSGNSEIDKGLIAFGKHSVNLEELVLIQVNATCVSLEVIATNCRNLVRLELNWCRTITDAEMMCIAEKCVALRTLVIEACDDVSNKGIEAFALGCPNLAEIRVTHCNKVTREVKDWLIARRGGKIECKINEWDFYFESSVFV